MYWGLLIGAIVFEVFGTLSLKYSSINSNTLATWLMIAFYALSFALLWGAIKKIDISVAYAIWSGVGTALITLVGAWLFKEHLGFMKLFFIGLIIIGAVGLKLSAEQ